MTMIDNPASTKPVSPSCERNRDPILAVLRVHFAACRQVLEIGSGTGQHAVHFAAAMPWLTWQCSDRAEHLPGIGQWLDAAGLANTPAPIELDVGKARQTNNTALRVAATCDGVFTANTLHIMAWPDVEAFFAVVAVALGTGSAASAASAAQKNDGVLVVYGPFNYGGDYSSDSNRVFDGWLQARDRHSGIRDFEAVDALAQSIGLRTVDDIAMPANNRCLVWQAGA